jgi:hypothetical protein
MTFLDVRANRIRARDLLGNQPVRSRIVLDRPHIRDYKVEELHRQTIGSKVLQ